MIRFIFLIGILVSTLFAATGTIDERITDIYFGNGVLTTEDKARDTLLFIVKPSVKDDIYHGDNTQMEQLHPSFPPSRWECI